jgi:hypothetical protein
MFYLLPLRHYVHIVFTLSNYYDCRLPLFLHFLLYAFRWPHAPGGGLFVLAPLYLRRLAACITPVNVLQWCRHRGQSCGRQFHGRVPGPTPLGGGDDVAVDAAALPCVARDVPPAAPDACATTVKATITFFFTHGI